MESLLTSRDDAADGASGAATRDGFADLYVSQFRSLVRMAALLLDDVAAAEDVVQDAYVRLAGSEPRLRDPNKALAYLRQTVLNLARSQLRRRLVAIRHAPKPAPDAAGADEGAYALVEQQAVVRALRQLPRRCREALVLRYYLDLTEAQTADALGVTVGAVKSYCSRGLDKLAVLLQELS